MLMKVAFKHNKPLKNKNDVLCLTHTSNPGQGLLVPSHHIIFSRNGTFKFKMKIQLNPIFLK